MKKYILIIALCIIPFSLIAKTDDDLDTVIKVISDNVSDSLQDNAVIAILDFDSGKKELGVYIRDQLASEVMAKRKLRLVTRQHTDIVLRELDYQLSGFVNEETALSICEQLGAQALVFGKIEESDNSYRLQIKMIDVETGAYILFKNYKVSRSQKIEQLLGQAASYYKTAIGLKVEGNMYAIKGISPGVGLGLDYNLTKRIAIGFNVNLFYDFSVNNANVLTIEPVATGRFYLVSPAGEPGTGIFVEGQAGAAIFTCNNLWKGSFAGGAGVGYRFGINNFYVEGAIRGGYPYIVGFGIITGARF